MFGILIDAAVIGIIVAAMESNEFPGWLPTIGCAVVIGVSTTLLINVLPGLWALLGIVGGAVIGAGVISAFCGMSVKRAGIVATIYFVYKVAISFLFLGLLGD